MAEYLIQDTSLTALADEIRELSGTTTPKSLDAMTSDVDAANTEIAEQAELLNQIATALEGKAGNPGGVVLPKLNNPASASDILSGKEAINGSGNKITGTITTQAAKTITPSTSSQTAVAKNVYTTGAITVAAIPSNYEDVATETSAYTTKLASLGAAITALETELAGKASGGSGGVTQTANVLTHTVYNSTLFYVGSNGITSISDQEYATVAMRVPSICFAKAPAGGFAATLCSGDCSMEFIDLRIAIFFVTGDASITVPGYESIPGDGA